MSRKAIIGTVILVIGLGLSLWYANRPTQVRGVVKLDGVPIAAGMITYSAGDLQLNAPIQDGHYLLDNGLTSGEYKVEIHVHFADPSDAPDFYRDMTKSLNSKSGTAGSQPDSMRPYVFDQQQIVRGSNTRNFQLKSSSP